MTKFALLLGLAGCQVASATPVQYPNRYNEAAAVRKLDMDLDGDGENDSMCTVWHPGILLKSEPIWVTARHCAREEALLTIGGKVVRVLKKSAEEDVALLVGGDVPAGALRFGPRPRFGDPVHFIGYPFYEATHFGMYGGFFSGPDGSGGSDGKPDDLFTAMVDGGASGSPLLNEAGEAVGVVVSSYRGRPYSYAEPIAGVRALFPVE